ncbi:MAG TPA: hypothetical protein PKG56_06395 [Chitinophagaceae bacterium]|nr:hypothetical protein [Chitinophagaceae bacterium]HNF28954.1 hypothetical protein [Chitinophagaceae bacterium]HNL83007.1 hypothetical protein [Chitinophagaceae bacterium]HNM33374.1 hypothetical protein [Chitinophagaceae bacterium]HNO49122.1 hypothetical protein [Chitinophagales bacterium]
MDIINLIDRKEILFFANRTSGTFCFAANAQANPKVIQKEPLLPTL